MIILEKPYISDFLKETIARLQLPVLDNEIARQLDFPGPVKLIQEKTFIDRVISQKNPVLYTNSENSIEWITRHLSETRLPEVILQTKDKHAFRELSRSLHPEFYYSSVNEKDLASLETRNIPKPFVIKPAVGFVSMGVYTVRSDSEWPGIVQSIRKEIEQTKGMYPPEVINTNKFIIEEYLTGDEFAVDAYFDSNGGSVILNIMKHLFSSEEDVDDKVYIMSAEIIENYLGLFTQALNNIGKLLDLQNFPLHVEFRVNDKYKAIPIEVNPMRFAGWCTTDIAQYAYGINVYEYFIKQIKPDWNSLLRDKYGITYSLNVAAVNNESPSGKQISFDYDALMKHFSKPLEIRKTDVNRYGMAGFLFAETSDPEIQELYEYLHMDTNTFIQYASVPS